MGGLVQSMFKPNSFKALLEPTLYSHKQAKDTDKAAAATEAENARITAENARKLRGNTASATAIPNTLLSSSSRIGEETQLGG